MSASIVRWQQINMNVQYPVLISLSGESVILGHRGWGRTCAEANSFEGGVFDITVSHAAYVWTMINIIMEGDKVGQAP